MKRTVWLAAAVLAAGMGASTGYAQCSSMTPRLTALWPASQPAAPTAEVIPAVATARVIPGDKGAPGSIVGLWQVTFTTGGQTVDQAFETFHSDGTELMIDTAPPASDNVCSGIWAQTDALSVKLKHPSWTFDSNGNLNGTATIRLSVTLGPSANRFSGTFAVDVYDLKGTLVFHTGGSVAGVRITVD